MEHLQKCSLLWILFGVIFVTFDAAPTTDPNKPIPEETLNNKLYGVLNDVLLQNFSQNSQDAVKAKVKELFMEGVEPFDIATSTIKGIVDLVFDEERPKREVFDEERKKREVRDDEVAIPKNELFDVMDEVFKKNFTEGSVGNYIKTVGGLVSSGVDPFKIIHNTLSNVVLLTLDEIEKKTANNTEDQIWRKELYDLIEDVIDHKFSKTSLDVYTKRVNELIAKGIDPFNMLVTVLGDVFVITLSEAFKGELKNNDVPPASLINLTNPFVLLEPIFDSAINPKGLEKPWGSLALFYNV